MTIEKLERVMWRLREQNKEKTYVHSSRLQLAVMYEIGTDMRTYKATRKALIKLGWIKTRGKTKIEITDKDLVES